MPLAYYNDNDKDACKQLGRRYLAFEIDPGRVEEARQRVRETQPLLFVTEPEPQQAEMKLCSTE